MFKHKLLIPIMLIFLVSRPCLSSDTEPGPDYEVNPDQIAEPMPSGNRKDIIGEIIEFSKKREAWRKERLKKLEDKQKQCKPAAIQVPEWKTTESWDGQLLAKTAMEIDVNLQTQGYEEYAEGKCVMKRKKELKQGEISCEKRFDSNCLRGIKYARCLTAAKASEVRSSDKRAHCNFGDYAQVGSAKNYDSNLKKEGWIDISCLGPNGKPLPDGQTMTPEQAPANSIIIYDAFKAPASDKNAKHGHAEIKVSNCLFCFDGCASGPRTGNLKSATGAGRKIKAIMIRGMNGSPQCNSPKKQQKAEAAPSPDTAT